MEKIASPPSAYFLLPMIERQVCLRHFCCNYSCQFSSYPLTAHCLLIPMTERPIHPNPSLSLPLSFVIAIVPCWLCCEFIFSWYPWVNFQYPPNPPTYYSFKFYSNSYIWTGHNSLMFMTYSYFIIMGTTSLSSLLLMRVLLAPSWRRLSPWFPGQCNWFLCDSQIHTARVDQFNHNSRLHSWLALQLRQPFN